MASYYPYLLAAHIIFVITWFAALFYIVRLYIYHRESMDMPDAEKMILHKQFSIMESRLMDIIGTPSMILVVASGISMLTIQTVYLQEFWMQWKLIFVAGVIAYHCTCLHIQKRLQRAEAVWSSGKLRMFNELATLLLVSVVFLVVLKNMLDMLYGLLGLVCLSMAMLIGIRIYKRRRENTQAGN